MKQTIVVNLLGSPCAGKSVLASDLFSELKKRNYKVEQVQEYVKSWAWSNRKITHFDQLYIVGHQSHRESILYGKVDYIITDSPLILSPFYQEYYSKIEIAKPSTLLFLNYAKQLNINHIYFYLPLITPYDPTGRFETEEQSKNIDIELKKWLNQYIKYDFLDCDITLRVKRILEKLGIE